VLEQTVHNVNIDNSGSQKSQYPEIQKRELVNFRRTTIPIANSCFESKRDKGKKELVRNTFCDEWPLTRSSRCPCLTQKLISCRRDRAFRLVMPSKSKGMIKCTIYRDFSLLLLPLRELGHELSVMFRPTMNENVEWKLIPSFYCKLPTR